MTNDNTLNEIPNITMIHVEKIFEVENHFEPSIEHGE